MRTENQKQASRNNGAKSSGPTSGEGKAISARNGNRHNLSGAEIILLSTEDPDEYLQHVADFMARFQPVDGVEHGLVNRLIAASWREKRMDAMEASLLELEMDRQRPDIEQEFETIDGYTRQTLALLGTTDRREAANLLLRYQAAARRSFLTAFKLLRELQGDRFNRQPAACPRPVEPPAGDPPGSAPAAPSAGPAPASASAKVILFRRRAIETAKLQTEPERVLAAGQVAAGAPPGEPL
jgi:hypothetical protein